MRLVLSAGETSGDHIGADLAHALIEQHPGIELAGLAGPQMQAAGVEPWIEMDQLNVMGLSEIIQHLPRLIRLRRAFRRRITDWQADAFIGIDAPDFNLGLARQLKKQNLTTMHYVSPSVWAWRAGRIPKIARALDLLLTLYPFEPALYAPYGLRAQFVGHHLADELVNAPSRNSAREQLALDQLQFDKTRPVIALLPGSRGGELKRHAQFLAETANQLRNRYPNAELLMLLARKADTATLIESTGDAYQRAGVRWLAGQTRIGLRAADIALTASGTVTLEAFLLGCPQVVFYRVAPSTYWAARTLHLVKSNHVSLPNILTQESLVPECLQQNATAQNLVDETAAWLNTPERVDDYRRRSQIWGQQLATGAGEQAAKTVLDFLQS